MSATAWLSILSLITTFAAYPLAIFVGRHWVIARITKTVQYGFDAKLEKLRTDFRESEERLKSELRDKEAEISALRTTVLDGSKSRQALLAKRQLDAVERIWTAVNDYTQLKALAATMASLNFKAIAADIDNPKLKEFLTLIGATAPDVKAIKNIARDERPFVPELAWAYFSAYSSVLMSSFSRYSVLKIGLSNPEQFLRRDATQAILKAVLPHQAKFIDEHEPEVYYYLLDEIELCLLNELRKILEGKAADEAAARHAKEIMAVIKANVNEQVADAK